jgi:hypothetical protein
MEEHTHSRLYRTLIEGVFDFIDKRVDVHQVKNRLAAIPPYPGLRRFADGRDFVQWTGDQTKALMKVLPFSLVKSPFI